MSGRGLAPAIAVLVAISLKQRNRVISIEREFASANPFAFTL